MKVGGVNEDAMAAISAKAVNNDVGVIGCFIEIDRRPGNGKEDIVGFFLYGGRVGHLFILLDETGCVNTKWDYLLCKI